MRCLASLVQILGPVRPVSRGFSKEAVRGYRPLAWQRGPPLESGAVHVPAPPPRLVLPPFPWPLRPAQKLVDIQVTAARRSAGFCLYCLYSFANN